MNLPHKIKSKASPLSAQQPSIKKKNNRMENSRSAITLTIQSLQQLKDSGFRFVLIKGYTTDRRVDYIEVNYFTLVPVKDLSEDPNKKEIYESIDSEILMQWASFPDDGAKVIIEMEPPNIVPCP
jgi:hypothetical protein